MFASPAPSGRPSRLTPPRRVLITGATSGIGLEAAKDLAGRGHTVIVHGRNEEKAEAAAARIRSAAHRGTTVETIAADLSRPQEISQLAAAIERMPRLDALVLNAGLYNRRRRETPDGIEETFMVNHLSQHLLVDRLDSYIRHTAGLRVIIVSSQAHHSANLDLQDLEMKHRKYVGWHQYSNTKLMNLLLTRYLAQRYKPYKVTVNALHPGVVNTGIVRRDWRAKPIFRIFGLPAKRGAQPIVHLVLDDAGERYTGHYFVETVPRRPRRAALNDDLSEELWRLGEEYRGRLAEKLRAAD